MKTMNSVKSVLTAICICDVVVAGVVAAPVGKSKPEKPLDIQGDWTLEWNTNRYVISIRPEGVYRCYGYGMEWVGTWELKGRTLTVKEWRSTQLGEDPLVWVIALDGELKGTIKSSREDSFPGKLAPGPVGPSL